MAESLRTSKENNNDKHRKRQRSSEKSEMNESRGLEEGRAESIPECAVCLQTCVHPAQLPCSHIFCFLCLKGLATQSRRCAMCRQDIPLDYLDHPQLLDVPSVAEKEAFEDGYQWFYEGRSGWWQYDERTSRELEAAYKSDQRTCELLIVGQLYIADFDAMLQLRRNDMARRRRIKRDLASIPKKGIAGLRLDGSQTTPPDSGDDVTLPSTSQEPSSVRLERFESQTVRTPNEGIDVTLLQDSGQNVHGEPIGPSYHPSNISRHARAAVESDEEHTDENGEESSENRESSRESGSGIGDNSASDLESQLRDLCLL